MTGEVVLSAALRNNLLSLQRTQSSIDRTQGILSTGLKVSSALDNPQSFFASQALKNRSSDLSALLDGIGQSIQTIKTADTGVTSLTKLVEQASSIVDSARDAITNGSKEAALTGTVNLSKITSNGATGGLTSVTGINTGAELTFTVKKADGTAVVLNNPGGIGAGSVNIVTGDSTEQLITKINDLVNSATGEAVLKAELTSAGYLKVTALNGGSFNMAFDADGTGVATTATTSTADQTFASALGFGGIAIQTSAGVAAASQVFTVSATATNNTKLTSGIFYKNGNSGFASASDLLTAVDDSDTGGQVRFSASANETSGITITVNGSKTSSKVRITGTTIQGLVDSINNDSNVGSLVKANYDATTGQFTIEAKNATVQTIKIDAVGSDNGAATRVDFDFGTSQAFLPGATAGISTGETFILASAASTLSQYEADYNKIRDQIDDLVEDSSYRGVNLLKGDTLDTYFNENRSNKLSTTGTNLSSTNIGIAKADFSRLDTIETAATQTRAGLSTLRNFGSTLANSLSVIQTRQDFTTNLINTLNEGSDKLTLADQNEEGAKLLALQTRQQLGVTALSLAAQAQQSVLRLF
jgi:flagellin-like hook-associated protein FlgL